MDWTLILVLLGFAAFLVGRLCLGVFYENSRLNTVLEFPTGKPEDESLGDDDWDDRD
ncbi:hypothetical protein LR948_13770 [Roseivivax sp. GX 12232]|uniref:hypothetical protein n=1 Tax=Roseivivax sp. GX 12232 TaxID=2900547 RepID=UPI001E63A1CF|nr:hypothetical protein [Roseivivax sp. GX 12232]MCE0506434.1 hypothetical protein [Roseivivax sp. GX 12232]